jgi:hypothetical protein
LRPKRIAQLEAELETLAYQEEQLVLAALAKGESVERRPGSPAWAILGVRIAQAKPAPAPVEKQKVRAVA